MHQLHSIVYVSSASRKFSASELSQILEEVREKNRKSGLTGILLHCDGNFMQLLEGPLNALEETMGRIRGSRRHRAVTEFMCEPIETREFAGWSMALSHATAPEFLELRNASWKAPVTAGDAPQESAGKELLRQFWQNTR
ncbi:MAG: BLUF domain-containing protein [Comamonadaceae bacterium]|nr:MAG: BLUF domain-containing protein [Comamonadaceae bacterium]